MREYYGRKKKWGTPPWISRSSALILSVYNAQNHLARCIGSILNQTYKNIELIILNDGSKGSQPARV